jgi:hypothetical protein
MGHTVIGSLVRLERVAEIPARSVGSQMAAP